MADLTSPRTRTGRLLIYIIRTLVPSDTERMNELFFRGEHWLTGSEHHLTEERHREYRQSD